jgi:hypothetical protein
LQERQLKSLKQEIHLLLQSIQFNSLAYVYELQLQLLFKSLLSVFYSWESHAIQLVELLQVRQRESQSNFIIFLNVN